MQTSRSILIRPDAITTKAMAIVLALVLFGLATPSQAASNQDELDFIAAQIQRAEADQASASLRQMIEQIERSQGRYAEDLVQPLSCWLAMQVSVPSSLRTGSTAPIAASLAQHPLNCSTRSTTWSVVL